MKQTDFDRLKAVCEKEGFELLNESANDNDKFFVVKKAKDIWEGVEFAECISNQAKDEYTLGKIYPISGKTIDTIRTLYDDQLSNENGWFKYCFKPSTESAYIEQLKAECFKRFGDINEGDKMFTEFDRETFIIDSGHGFDYYKTNDELRFNGWSIYQQGKWATRVKERVKVEYSGASCKPHPINDNMNIHEVRFYVNHTNGLPQSRAFDFLASKLEEYLNKE